MVRIERVLNPFSAENAYSFACIKEEQKYYDALHYAYSDPSKHPAITAFDNFQSTFAMYLLINEQNTWIGYISYYNDEYIQKKCEELKQAAADIIYNIPYSSNELRNWTIEEFKKLADNTIYIFQFIQGMIEIHHRVFYNEEIRLTGFDSLQFQHFLGKCNDILTPPTKLYVEMAVYDCDWVQLTETETICLLQESLQYMMEDEYFKTAEILIKEPKNQSILYPQEFIKETPDFYEYKLILDKKEIQ